MDLDLWADLIRGDPRPLFQAAPVDPMLGCTGRVFGATDLLGRPWGQIGPIWGPFRGRPTLENHAPAWAGSRFSHFRPNSFRPSLRRPFGPYLGPFGGRLGPCPGPPGALVGPPGGPDLTP